MLPLDSPNSAITLQGTQLEGTSENSNTTVMVGDIPCDVGNYNSEIIIFVPSQGSAGIYNITVIVDDYGKADGFHQVLYPFAVYNISDTAGSIAGTFIL